MTVRQVIDWHAANYARSSSAVAEKERRRVRCLFCTWSGPACTEGQTVEYGDWPITSCRAADLLEFINGECSQADNTRRRWCQTLQKPFNKAAGFGLIGRNPFKAVSSEMPEGEHGRDISDAEFRALLRLSNANFRRVLIFLRFSGCRPGEMSSLEWDQVHWESASIVKHKHKTKHKTRKPRRVALTHLLRALLTWIQRRQGPGQTHVFLNADGRPWNGDALCKHLRRKRELSGLGDDVKLYGCRHAYGTNAVLNGVELPILADLMGHRNTSTTEIYVHLSGLHEYLNQRAEEAAKPRPRGSR